MSTARRTSRTLLVLVSAACQPGAAETSPFTTAPPMTSSPDASSGSSTGSTGGSSSTGGELSTGSGSGTASTTASTGVSTFDVGTRDDFGPGKPAGCAGKIDFLFVISRYAGMEYFQAQLLDAFPKFIDTIEAKFADFDYHIMVVDGGSAGGMNGEPYWGLPQCNEQCPCAVSGYPCDYTPTTCDLTIGAGTVFPAGDGASNTLCKIDGGRRFMTKGQTDLKNTFACAAQVGSSSNRAWIGEALTAAVLPVINQPGGCNAGFLRSDALLMATLISNTYDVGEKPFGSNGTPETWASAVLAAKNEDPAAIVMLSILDPGQPECDPLDRTCQVVRMFPNSLLTDVWADDYGPAFDEAAALVLDACADFVPPG